MHLKIIYQFQPIFLHTKLMTTFLKNSIQFPLGPTSYLIFNLIFKNLISDINQFVKLNYFDIFFFFFFTLSSVKLYTQQILRLLNLVRLIKNKNCTNKVSITYSPHIQFTMVIVVRYPIPFLRCRQICRLLGL